MRDLIANSFVEKSVTNPSSSLDRDFNRKVVLSIARSGFWQISKLHNFVNIFHALLRSSSSRVLQAMKIPRQLFFRLIVNSRSKVFFSFLLFKNSLPH